MDMVFPHIEFQDFQKLLLIAQHIHPLSGVFSNFILEYPESVFRAEHDMIFTFIDCV
jgi:hypothetical protein